MVLRVRFGIAILFAAWALAVVPGAARGGTVLTFDLGEPTVTGTTAALDLTLNFTGDPGDEIEILTLDVGGSDLLLTGNNTDFSRFSFVLNTAGLPTGFSMPVPLSDEGYGLIEAEIGGPYLIPSATPYLLGTLFVDLTGLPDGVSPTVSLVGSRPGFGTDAFGSIGGIPRDDPFSAYPALVTVTFADPGGVPLPTAAVPEPGGLAMIGSGAFALLGYLRWRRRRVAS